MHTGSEATQNASGTSALVERLGHVVDVEGHLRELLERIVCSRRALNRELLAELRAFLESEVPEALSDFDYLASTTPQPQLLQAMTALAVARAGAAA